jgi:hypothetical protein
MNKKQCADCEQKIATVTIGDQWFTYEYHLCDNCYQKRKVSDVIPESHIVEEIS